MKDEGIVIGDGVVITVMEIQGDEVRLSIEHPPGVPVEKKEVCEAVEQGVETSPPP
jgi:carbon storage regulator